MTHSGPTRRSSVLRTDDQRDGAKGDRVAAPLTDAAENSGADRDDSGGDEERADDQGRGDRRGQGPEERGHAEDQREEAVGEQTPPAGAHRRSGAPPRVAHRATPPCYAPTPAEPPTAP